MDYKAAKSLKLEAFVRQSKYYQANQRFALSLVVHNMIKRRYIYIYIYQARQLGHSSSCVGLARASPPYKAISTILRRHFLRGDAVREFQC